jgi:hypothetical protein
MSHAREMLEAAPTELTLPIGEVAAAIDACLDSLQACTTCADESLAEKDVGDMRLCIALCFSCADVCTVTARALSRPSHWDHAVVNDLLQACVRTCTSCSEECERHAQHHRHCAICARTCRACERACTDLLESDTLKELEKLAGG